tara:strand:- start:416 stop:1360 length:945 start_codon:yes stop_codon:yes gene_type:complete
MNFGPDFVWIKDRSVAWGHQLFDSVRGIYKTLNTASSLAEASNVQYLTAFKTDGFTVGTNSVVNNGSNPDNYVAWTWNAGSSTVSNTDGSGLTSVNVNANQSAGFSIVSYTGSTGTGSFGHGLNAAPELVIIKNREENQNWTIYHKSLTLGDYLKFTNDAAIDYPMFNDAHPSSSVVYVGNDDQVSKNGIDYIAYCFTSVEGFSSFGSYQGNDLADGPFVFTGHRPRFLIIKCSTKSGEDWLMLDTARDAYNDGDSSALYASLQHTDNSTSTITTDILSNGFKVRATNAAVNQSGETYLYMSFASHPFRTARAR